VIQRAGKALHVPEDVGPYRGAEFMNAFALRRLGAWDARVPHAQYVYMHRCRARGARATITMLALIVALPLGATAQAIQGTVVARESELPVARATVRVLDGGELVGSAISDDQGFFEIRLRSHGLYAVQATALGYAPTEPAPIQVGARELVAITLRLSSSPIPLPALEVETRRRDPRNDATYEGLYARWRATPKVGSVRVITRDDVELRSSARVQDVMRWLIPPKECVDYFVNGMPISAELWGVLDYPVAAIEGIEYYREGWSAPFDYHAGPCRASPAVQITDFSVVALWHRRPSTQVR
jgi:hypothetical protein